MLNFIEERTEQQIVLNQVRHLMIDLNDHGSNSETRSQTPTARLNDSDSNMAEYDRFHMAYYAQQREQNRQDGTYADESALDEFFEPAIQQRESNRRPSGFLSDLNQFLTRMLSVIPTNPRHNQIFPVEPPSRRSIL